MNSVKSYLKRGSYNSFFFILCSALSKILNFFFLPFILSKLTLEEFGILDSYQFIFSISVLVFSSLSTSSITRFYLAKDDEEYQKKIIGNSTLLILFFASSLIVYGFLFEKDRLSILIIASTALYTIYSLVLTVYKTTEKIWVYTICSIFQTTTATLMTVMFIKIGLKIDAFFLATTASLIPFIPLFFLIIKNNFKFSLAILKEQLVFSIPLLFYSFIYMIFFVTDRFFLKNMNFEALGIYSLLWRFGSIFQFITIGINEALPLIFFNAEKEFNSDKIISHLMRIYSIIFISIALVCNIVSYLGILIFFPRKYHFLISYLPIFIASLTCFELARTLQMGFALKNRTYYAPLTSSIALIIQIVCCLIFLKFNIWGILISNLISSLLYLIINYQLNAKICPNLISETIFCKTLLYFIFFLISCYYSVIIIGKYVSLLFFIFWVLIIWKKDILSKQEKEIINNLLKNIRYLINSRIYQKIRSNFLINYDK